MLNSPWVASSVGPNQSQLCSLLFVSFIIDSIFSLTTVAQLNATCESVNLSSFLHRPIISVPAHTGTQAYTNLQPLPQSTFSVGGKNTMSAFVLWCSLTRLNWINVSCWTLGISLCLKGSSQIQAINFEGRSTKTQSTDLKASYIQHTNRLKAFQGKGAL